MTEHHDPQQPVEMLFRGAKGDKGEPGEKGERGLTSRMARAIVGLFLIAFVLAGASLLITSREIAANDAKWCAAMVLLTSHPVPKPANPGANPSRAQNYQYYVTFRTLRRRLGCG